MQMKVKLVFNDSEREALNQFQTTINHNCEVNGEEFLTMEQLCKQSIFYAISDSYRRAQAMREQMDAEAEKARRTKEADKTLAGFGILDQVNTALGVTNGDTTVGVTANDNAPPSGSTDTNPEMGPQPETSGDTDLGTAT